MSSNRTPSLKTIAEMAGVTPATVSLALRNSLSISKGTGDKIREIALKVGYRRNNLVSTILSQARNVNTNSRGAIAFLHYWPSQHEWEKFTSLHEQYLGVKASAESAGFNVDVVWGKAPELTAHRLNDILLSRGIRMILIPMIALKFTHPRLDWKEFSVVTLGWRSRTPELSYVLPDQDEKVWQTIRVLKHRGYKRIGLALWRDAWLKTEGKYAARYLLYQNDIPHSSRLSIFLPESWAEWNYKNFEAWMHREKPDVIICQADEVEPWLKQMGLRVPEDVGFVHMDLPHNQPNWSGMKTNGFQIGCAAVELLLSQSLLNGPGLPVTARGILINNQWCEGKTIRKGHPGVPLPRKIKPAKKVKSTSESAGAKA